MTKSLLGCFAIMALLSGCRTRVVDYPIKGDSAEPSTPEDQDGDGYGPDEGDCDDEDPALNPDTIWYIDYDDDGYGSDDYTLVQCEAPEGYVLDDTDCDDTAGAIFPGAEEYCDGVDTDCDGTVDEDDAVDASTWYVDTDSDGFGDAATASEACAQPTDCVADATDCDDSEPAINPGATEVCNGVDDDCDGDTDEDDAIDAIPWFLDSDGDGFGDGAAVAYACSQPSSHAADGTDCDDSDAEVNPDAIEVCNGVDDDCDGDTDEDDAIDSHIWYLDADGDGYGDSTSTRNACEQPTSYVTLGDPDCDDSDAEINPGAVEICDDADNDCDGDVDEPDTVETTVWYADADGDGFGDPSSSVADCEQPTDYVHDDTDCDDSDASIHPGASETDCTDPTDYNCDGSVGYADVDGDGYAACEDCDDANASVHPDATEFCDGIDNDCDETVDEGDATDAANWYADTDGDAYGDAGSTITACDQPSGYVADDTDCDDADPAVHPGADEYCDGVDSDCDGLTDEDDSLDASTWYADTDGDGFGDITSAINTCEPPTSFTDDNTDCDDTDETVNPDAEEVCEDGIDNDCDGTSLGCGISGDLTGADATAALVGESYSDGIGTAVAGVGDINGDGYPDLLVSSHIMDSYTGAAFLVHGPVSGELDLAGADAVLSGEAPSDHAGWTLAGAGDVNADGYDDLLVGSVDGSVAYNAGAVYLMLGPVSGGTSLSSADAKLTGTTDNETLAYVTKVRDLNGDGYDDIAAGASGYPDAGAACVWLGPVSGTSDLTSADAILEGESSSDSAGMGIAGVGDVDGDGLADLLVGAPGNSSDTGAAYLALGPLTSSFNLSAADSKLTGESTGDQAGRVVSAAGDVDADGHADLLIGAPYESTADYRAGAAYLVLGPVTGTLSLSTADLKITGAAAYEYFGEALTSAGDVDADGYDDILLGCEDSGSSGEGRAYLFLALSTGTLSATDAAATISGVSASDGMGASVAAAGDVDLDGYDDVLVGAPGEDAFGYERGAVYLFLGSGM